MLGAICGRARPGWPDTLQERFPLSAVLLRVALLGVERLFLRALQSLELDAVGADLGEIVVRLLRQPAFRAAAEDFGQAYRHLRRNPVLFIDKLGQSRAGHAQRCGGAGISSGQTAQCTGSSQGRRDAVDFSSAWRKLLQLARQLLRHALAVTTDRG